ncbi:MAG: hypothetical protein K2I06_08550 [Ruminococcus sp.]|nr:hypothetical protein [Ruminococcus sp.]
MYKKNEFRRKIDAVINQSSDMTDEQKFIWSEVFRNLADYQEELFSFAENGNNKINSDYKWNIVCGITDSRTLPKGFEFVSCADDLNEILKKRRSEDDYDKIESELICNNRSQILNIGYIDVPYNEISDYCGREKKYKGVLADGVMEFSYSLILHNSLLHQEKILYNLLSLYKIDAPVIYSPYFRRMIYVETDCKEAENGCDLKLEKNNLFGKLKLNFRSIWNVSVSSNPAGVQKCGVFYYTLGKNTFIIAEKKYENRLDIEITENGSGCEVKVTPKDAEINPKNYMIKAEINHVENYVVGSVLNEFNFVNNGKYPENINHIYSRSDVYMIMNGFSEIVKFIDVYTKRPENMVVCNYEKHFEYPLSMRFFQYTDRPVLYLNFENDKYNLLHDRIVYTVHQIQRLFPEYIWKGGYIK